jgi:hypothetical protein
MTTAFNRILAMRGKEWLGLRPCRLRRAEPSWLGLCPPLQTWAVPSWLGLCPRSLGLHPYGLGCALADSDGLSPCGLGCALADLGCALVA